LPWGIPQLHRVPKQTPFVRIGVARHPGLWAKHPRRPTFSGQVEPIHRPGVEKKIHPGFLRVESDVAHLGLPEVPRCDHQGLPNEEQDDHGKKDGHDAA